MIRERFSAEKGLAEVATLPHARAAAGLLSELLLLSRP